MAAAVVDSVISANDVRKLSKLLYHVPPAEESYLEEDFIMNLLETVLDYQMLTIAVVRALEHFRERRWDEVCTLDDLDTVLWLLRRSRRSRVDSETDDTEISLMWSVGVTSGASAR